jgi:hypothetical protein
MANIKYNIAIDGLDNIVNKIQQNAKSVEQLQTEYKNLQAAVEAYKKTVNDPAVQKQLDGQIERIKKLGDSADKDFKKFEKSANRASKASAALSQAVGQVGDTASGTLTKAAGGASSLVSGLLRIGAAAGPIGIAIAGALGTVVAGLASSQDNLDEFSASWEGLKSVTGEFFRNLKTISSQVLDSLIARFKAIGNLISLAFNKLIGDTEAANKALEDLKKSATELTNADNALFQSFSRLGNVFNNSRIAQFAIIKLTREQIELSNRLAAAQRQLTLTEAKLNDPRLTTIQQLELINQKYREQQAVLQATANIQRNQGAILQQEAIKAGLSIERLADGTLKLNEAGKDNTNFRQFSQSVATFNQQVQATNTQQAVTGINQLNETLNKLKSAAEGAITALSTNRGAIEEFIDEFSTRDINIDEEFSLIFDRITETINKSRLQFEAAFEDTAKQIEKTFTETFPKLRKLIPDDFFKTGDITIIPQEVFDKLPSEYKELLLDLSEQRKAFDRTSRQQEVDLTTTVLDEINKRKEAEIQAEEAINAERLKNAQLQFEINDQLRQEKLEEIKANSQVIRNTRDLQQVRQNQAEAIKLINDRYREQLAIINQTANSERNNLNIQLTATNNELNNLENIKKSRALTSEELERERQLKAKILLLTEQLTGVEKNRDVEATKASKKRQTEIEQLGNDIQKVIASNTEIATRTISAVGDLLNNLGQLFQQQFENQLTTINNEFARIDARNAEIDEQIRLREERISALGQLTQNATSDQAKAFAASINEEKKGLAQLNAERQKNFEREKKLRKEEAAIKSKQFDIQKTSDIGQAVTSGALAIINATAAPFPINTFLPFIVGAAVATQIATVASRKKPDFNAGLATGGMVDSLDIGGYTPKGSKYTPVPVQVHAGEWVAPKWQVESPKFGPIISYLEKSRQAGGMATGGNVSTDNIETLVREQPVPIINVNVQEVETVSNQVNLIRAQARF